MSESSTKEEVDAYGHPRIPHRGYYERGRCDLRRRWVEKFASSSLTQLGQWWKDEGTEDSRSCLKLKGNIENPIGLAKIPTGVAGPLLMEGQHVSGYMLLPFATTEGALVASTTRGAAALNRSGGVHVVASEQRQLRCPVFVTRSAMEALQLFQWLESNLHLLQKQVRLFSQYATLIRLTPHYQGRNLCVTFIYATGDAAGQNMVTTATWNACKWALTQVEKDLPGIRVTEFCVESMHSLDKRSSSVSMTISRGVYVQAEAWIPESILRSTLKVDLQALLSTYDNLKLGSIQAGVVGFEINLVNTIVGVFIATGQDVAAAIESSNGLFIVQPVTQDEMESRILSKTVGTTSAEKLQKVDLLSKSSGSARSKPAGVHYTGVYVSMIIPSLVVGTVGGGTALATQKECLAMMGCYGQGNIFRFAEIIAGFALALDLSTLSALASGTFATAHEKLGRNHPTHGLKPEHLNREFFQRVIGERGKVESWNPANLNTGNSILSEVTEREKSKKVGHFGFSVNYSASDGVSHVLSIVIKSKQTDVETCNLINKMAVGCGFELATLYERHKMDIGLRFCDQREVKISQLDNPVLKHFMPAIYYTWLDPTKDIYVIVMERLSDENISFLNTADDISDWTSSDIKVVLRDMARIHSVYLNQTEWLSACPWLEHVTGEKMAAMASLWTALLDNAHLEFPDIWTVERVELIRRAVSNIPRIWSSIDSAPHTLVHNDFNPRNSCIRTSSTNSSSHLSPTPQPTPLAAGSTCSTGSGVMNTAAPYSLQGSVPFPDERSVCVYDWELATIEVPQRDLVEFLAFILHPSCPPEEWLGMVEFYRRHLEFYSGVAFPADKFLEVFHASCFHFAMKRLSLYSMIHTYKDYRFLPRVVNSLFSFLTVQMEKDDFRPILENVRSKL